MRQPHYQRGMVLKGLGQLEQALLSLDVALKLQPDYAECLANRGVLLQEMQRPDEALACYDRALQYAPRSALLHYNPGHGAGEIAAPRRSPGHL